MQAHIWGKLMLSLGSPPNWISEALLQHRQQKHPSDRTPASHSFELGLFKPATVTSSPRMTGRLLMPKIQVLL